MIAEGSIDPGNYVVKCGGLDGAVSLIQAVSNREIDGKGVIYPHASYSLRCGRVGFREEASILRKRVGDSLTAEGKIN